MDALGTDREGLTSPSESVRHSSSDREVAVPAPARHSWSAT